MHQQLALIALIVVGLYQVGPVLGKAGEDGILAADLINEMKEEICSVCRNTMRNIVANKLEEDFARDLSDECDFLPEDDKKVCRGRVDTIKNRVVGKRFESACGLLGYCASGLP